MQTRSKLVLALAPTLREGDVLASRGAEAFRSYLESVLTLPVELTRFDDYQATLLALREDRVDAAMVGDYVSRSGEALGDLIQLVSPVSADQEAQTYRSVIVTRIDSGIRSLSQIKGTRVGLVDAQSTSGYIVPRAMLREVEIDPDSDFETVLLGSHRAVMEAIIAGEVDAGAAHENRLQPPSLDRGPDYARLRVLMTSRPIPNGPIVVRTSLEKGVQQRLADAFLHIHEAAPEAARMMLRSGNRFTLASTRGNPTLKSVAALAGVSYATVSRVANKTGYVAPGTAARVQAIIDELGYTPNGHAQVLMGRKAPLIGYVTAMRSKKSLTAMNQVREAFQQAGIPMVVCPVEDELTNTVYPELLRDKRLGALIVTGKLVNDPEVTQLAKTGHAVIALTDRAVPAGVVHATDSDLVSKVQNEIRQLPG